MTLPKSSSVVAGVEGMIRYNTSTHQVEVFQGNAGSSTAAWRTLRFKEATQITKETFTGDGVNAVFPLSTQPPTTVESGATWGDDNLIVIVGGVYQIGFTNYEVVLGETITIGPTALGPYTTGQYYIKFTSSSPGLDTLITVLHGFDQ
jgi:hypothetical protein